MNILSGSKKNCLFSTLPVTRICQHASIVVISIIILIWEIHRSNDVFATYAWYSTRNCKQIGKTPEDRQRQFYNTEISITILARYCEWFQSAQIQCHGFLEYFTGNWFFLYEVKEDTISNSINPLFVFF